MKKAWLFFFLQKIYLGFSSLYWALSLRFSHFLERNAICKFLSSIDSNSLTLLCCTFLCSLAYSTSTVFFYSLHSQRRCTFPIHFRQSFPCLFDSISLNSQCKHDHYMAVYLSHWCVYSVVLNGKFYIRHQNHLRFGEGLKMHLGCSSSHTRPTLLSFCCVCSMWFEVWVLGESETPGGLLNSLFSSFVI